jgi:DNA invertase Pin-like site-specific DNA recombinase
VDRLGRWLQHLLAFLSELKAKNVDLYLHQQAVDTSTPAGRALFQMLGVFAEFERAMIVERVEKAVLLELGKGHGIHTVTRAVGVGTGTVQRIMRRVAVA